MALARVTELETRPAREQIEVVHALYRDTAAATVIGRMGSAREIVVAVVAFAVVLGIWWADRLTPDDLRFGFLYMFPIGAVAWWGPRPAALACAALAAVCLVSN